jgi:hypothetical protein
MTAYDLPSPAVYDEDLARQHAQQSLTVRAEPDPWMCRGRKSGDLFARLRVPYGRGVRGTRHNPSAVGTHDEPDARGERTNAPGRAAPIKVNDEGALIRAPNDENATVRRQLRASRGRLLVEALGGANLEQLVAARQRPAPDAALAGRDEPAAVRPEVGSTRMADPQQRERLGGRQRPPAHALRTLGHEHTVVRRHVGRPLPRAAGPGVVEPAAFLRAVEP